MIGQLKIRLQRVTDYFQKIIIVMGLLTYMRINGVRWFILIGGITLAVIIDYIDWNYIFPSEMKTTGNALLGKEQSPVVATSRDMRFTLQNSEQSQRKCVEMRNK